MIVRSRALLLQLAFMLAAWFFSALAIADNVFPGASWSKVAVPDVDGWDSGKLISADDYAHTLFTQSYLIIQHGKIVHGYGDISKATNIYSMRKSVLSILMGKYVDTGVVKLDQTIGQLHITDKGGLSEQEQQATVRQLIQARSGIYHPAAYETRAMAAGRPARDSFKPGEHWYYNNWDFNTVGAIFTQFTGKSIFDALRDDLANPLQFEDFNVSANTRLVYESASDYPAYTMSLSARDLARIGWLMAQGGNWKGHQIVSRQWVNESTTSYSNVGPGIGYGYMWWVGLHGITLGQQFPGEVFSARGNYGQYVVVVPGLELVIVHKVENETGITGTEVTSKQFGKLLGLIMAARVPEPTIKNLAENEY